MFFEEQGISALEVALSPSLEDCSLNSTTRSVHEYHISRKHLAMAGDYVSYGPSRCLLAHHRYRGFGGSTLSDWGLQNALGAKGGHCNFQPKQERCTMGARHRVDPVPCRIHGHRCGVVRHVAVAEVGWAATRIFESSCA